MTSSKITGGEVTREMSRAIPFTKKATHVARKEARFTRKANKPRGIASEGSTGKTESASQGR